MIYHGHKLRQNLGWLSLILLFAFVSTDSDPGVPYIEGQQDVCQGYICLYGGSCVNTTGKAECACLDGFSGSRCEIVISAPEKEGTCPSVPADESGQCPGYVCATDVICPGTQKCCPSECSTKVCVEPDPSTEAVTCDNVRCPGGTTCLVIRSSAGSPGQTQCVLDADRTCWASGFAQAHLIPSETDPDKMNTIPCGGFMWFRQLCPRGTWCSWPGLGYRSICCSGRRRFHSMNWIRQLRLHRREASGADPCGGCLDGQRCRKFAVQCENQPCPPPEYRCVDSTTPFLAECQPQCPEHFMCVMQAPRCEVNTHSSSSSSSSSGGGGSNSDSSTSKNQRVCDLTPRPTCIPKPGGDMRNQ